MRAEYTLALRRESDEFVRAMVDRLVEQSYEHVQETLAEVMDELGALVSPEVRHKLVQLDKTYLRAIEFAARGGIGGQVTPKDKVLRGQRRPIPRAAMPAPVERDGQASADPDQVINVRPCG